MISSALLRSLSWSFSVSVIMIQGMLAFTASRYLDKSNEFRTRLLQRTCFYPAASGLVGFLCGGVMPQPSTLATSLLLFFQVWSFAGGVVMLLVYPASILQAVVPQDTQEAWKADALSERYNARRFLIPTYNGYHIDTLTVKQKYPTQHWVMCIGGNAQFMDSTFDSMADIVDELRANAFVINPRGIGRSTGYVAQLSDLVEDAATAAHYVVHQEKIDPRRLLFLGHSIGGGVAVQLAHRVFPTSALVVDRSFSSMTDAATHFSPLTPAVTSVVFPLLVGDLNSIESWNGITHDRKLVLYAVRDEIINYKVSSIARIDQFHNRGHPDYHRAIKLHSKRDIQSWHNAPLSTFEEWQEILKEFNRLLSS